MTGAIPPLERRERRWLFGILFGGLAVRLLVAPFGEFEFDIDSFATWATALADGGPADFYAATDSDHLPGDLWILALLGEAFHLVDADAMLVDSSAFTYAVKCVAIVGDIAIAALLFAIARRLAGPRAGLFAAAAWAFNPAAIFLSSFWGQWDSLSAAVVLLAVWCFIRGWIAVAFPLLTYAALIKPQFTLLGVAFIVFLAFSRAEPRPQASWWRGTIGQLALGGAGSLLVLGAVTTPFDALPWGEHSVFDRAQVALDVYPLPTVSGFNLWVFWFQPPLSSLGNFFDSETVFLGLSYRTMGTALLALTVLSALVVLARHADFPHLVWTSLLITLAVFMLPTRVHERYLLPAVCFSIAMAALDRRYRPVAALLSLTFLGNMFWVYDFVYGPPLIPSGAGRAFAIGFGVVNVALLAFVILTRPSSSATAKAHDSHDLGASPWRRRLRGAVAR